MNIDFTTLALISVLTTLTTEAIKKLMDKADFNYVSNIIAVIVSVILSAVIVVIKPIITEGAAFTPVLAYNGIVMAFLAVLASMLTFDKIVQSLKGLND